MADAAIRKKAEEGQEKARTVVQHAKEVEALSQLWLDRAIANPPRTNEERAEFSERAAQFRSLATDRLAYVSQACLAAATLAGQLEELAPEDQALALRIQLAPILEAEAATARAIALVLDAYSAMEAVSYWHETACG